MFYWWSCGKTGPLTHGLYECQLAESLWRPISFPNAYSLWHRNSTLSGLSHRYTSMCTKQYVHKAILSRTASNKPETTQMSPLWAVCCLVAKSYPTLCDPMDCSMPGSFVHGISQGRTPEWVAISFSRGSSQPRNQTHISCTGSWILYHWTTRGVHHESVT